MEQEIFNRRKSKITEVFSGGKYLESAWLCSALRKELEESASKDSQPDSQHLGWLKSYHFHSLVRSGDMKGAYELYHLPEPYLVSLPQESQRKMDRSMKKVCTGLQKVEELLRFGRLELGYLLSESSPQLIQKRALEQCQFFRELGRDDLNFEFALYLLKANQDSTPSYVEPGFHFLLRNFESTLSETIGEILLSHLSVFLNTRDNEVSAGDLQVSFDRLETLLVSDHYIRRSQPNQNLLEKALNSIQDNHPEGLRRAILEGSPLYYLDDGQRNSLLSFAIEKDRGACTALLIQYHCDVHGSSGAWTTPLHKSCALGRLKISAQLLEKGASLNLSDHQGYDALDHAILSGNIDLVRMLLHTGANPDKGIGSNHSRVVQSLKNDSSQILRALIQSGANPFHQPDGEDSLLHLSIKEDAPNCLRELMKWNSNHTDRESAQELARQLGREKCIDILDQ